VNFDAVSSKRGNFAIQKTIQQRRHNFEKI